MDAESLLLWAPCWLPVVSVLLAFLWAVLVTTRNVEDHELHEEYLRQGRCHRCGSYCNQDGYCPLCQNFEEA